MRILHFVIFLSFFVDLNAQDLLVTAYGDSIECYVTNERNFAVYFTKRDKNGNFTEKALLPNSQVVSISKNFFGKATTTEAQKTIKNQSYEKVRFSIYGGYSRRLAPDPENTNGLGDYFKQLKNGYAIGADFAFFLSKRSAIGLKYSVHRSKTSLSAVFTPPSGPSQLTTISDDISINFIAPTYTARFLSADQRSAFLLRGALGLVLYRNDYILLQPYTITATTAALMVEAGYDLAITDALALSFSIGFYSGYYEDYEEKDPRGQVVSKSFPQGSGDNLARVDICGGLKYGF